MILIDETILKHKFIIVNKSIETAIVDQLLKLFLLLLWNKIVFIEFVLLLENWDWFVWKIGIVGQNVEGVDVAEIESIVLDVTGSVHIFLYFLAI